MARLPTGPYRASRTGCYGCSRNVPADGSCGIHGYPCIHYGLDLFADSPEVVAPEAGIIFAISDGRAAPFQGYGPGVVLMLGMSGYFHLLSHLRAESVVVSRGAFVTEGQRIAQIDPKAAHVHYEVRLRATGDSRANTIDPLVWIKNQSSVAADKQKPERSPSGANKFFIGLAITAAAFGAGAVAYQLAKTAAKFPPVRTPRPV